MWRLLLAWMVIASHTKGYQELFSVNVGTIAVSTFFFISGFLMPLTYQKHYQKNGFLEGCGRFYINRLLRIFPIYWASLLCVLALYLGSYILHGHLKVDFNFTTYIQNFLLIGLNQSTLWGGYHRFNNPAWTLDVELQYYFLVPLLLILATKYKFLQTIVFIGFGLVSCYLYLNPVGLVDIDRSILAWAIFFFLGFAFYESVGLNSSNNIATLTLLIIIAIVFSANNDIEIYTFFITMAFIALSAMLLNPQKKYKSDVCLAGNLSYPVYIFHIVFLSFTAKIIDLSPIINLSALPKFIVTFVVHVVVSTMIGYVALKLISDPIDSIRAKVRDSNKQSILFYK